jgi:hypothetical protein
MSLEHQQYLNIGSLVTDPDYPEDGVGMIVRVEPHGHGHGSLSHQEIYRIHSFVSGHSVWLDKVYVEDECKLVYSTGKTRY